ncbi:MAG: dCTP deaminase [Candidatus Thermoplasmatota archaeon]|jgi:dCTP deaminase
MAVWSDSDFLAAVGAGTFKAEPWHAQDLTPNGLDLRIAHVLVPSVSAEPVSSGTAIVPPMTRFIVGTEAMLTMPREAVGSLWIRSSYSRKGVIAAFGKVDAGFHGNLTVGAFNAGNEALSIPIGDRFCQVVLEMLHSAPTRDYGATGRYQGQRGITLARTGDATKS